MALLSYQFLARPGIEGEGHLSHDGFPVLELWRTYHNCQIWRLKRETMELGRQQGFQPSQNQSGDANGSPQRCRAGGALHSDREK